MKRLGMNIASLSIAMTACTTQQAANIQAAHAWMVPIIIAVCKVDKVGQPIFVPLASAVVTAVVPASSPVVNGAVNLDTNVVHPAVEQACAAVDAEPVAVVPVAAVPSVTDGVTMTMPLDGGKFDAK